MRARRPEGTSAFIQQVSNGRLRRVKRTMYANLEARWPTDFPIKYKFHSSLSQFP